MRGENQIEHADEALQLLFARFRSAPESPAFVELSAALLARGHASEAAQIAEHGLQLRPDDANGRIQRAAALLALGRGRVAYVELLRALAIDATNRRGLRLLGRVFVEAGFPERAAQLLKRRLEISPPTSSSSVDTRALTAQPLVSSEPPPPLLENRPDEPIPAEASTNVTVPDTDIPELFATLTKDLGLTPIAPVSTKVEVTQVMRLRRPRDRGRALSSIEGPIVESTNPGKIDYSTEESVPPEYELGLLSSPGELADSFGLDPLAVRGVQRDDDPDTLNEELPAPIALEQLGEAMSQEARRLSGTEDPAAIADAASTRPTEISLPVFPTELVRPTPPALTSAARDEVPTAEPLHVRRFEKGRAAIRERVAPPPAEEAKPTKNESRARPIRVVRKKVGLARVLLAIAAGLLLAVFLFALAYLARDDLKLWMAAPGPDVSPSNNAPVEGNDPSPNEP